MTMMSAILVFAPPDRLDSKIEQENFLAQLQVYGFRVIVCETLSAVYQLMQHGMAPSGAGSAPEVKLAILSGSSSDNCATAASLRTLYPQLAIMVVMSAHDTAEAIQALQGGADAVFSSDTPDQLRIAMLMALMRSRQLGPATLVDAQSEASWRLQDKGWTLINPHGVAITLTTGERAFMQALLASVDRNVSRSELLRAMGGDEALKAGSGANRRLGVIVSRMRRKIQKHGLDLPLQAVHGAGYMFTARLE